MHGLLGLAGLLGLIALAFGKQAASVVAAIILVTGTVFMLWLSIEIILGRI
jgi:hypothetical protein